MKLDSMYQEIILDHYKNPNRRGLREPYDGESFQVNPTCGDEVTLRVHVAGAGDGTGEPSADGSTGDATITDVSHDGQGCSISQASVSVLTDLVVGATVKQAAATMEAFVELMQGRGQVEPDEDVLADGIAFAGVAKYPARVKCALLGWMALKSALVEAGQYPEVNGVEAK